MKLTSISSNHAAKSLASEKTFIVGLIVERLSDAFFARLAHYVEKSAEGHGYKVWFCSTENDNNRARSLINQFRLMQVDAFIIVPTPGIRKEIKTLIKDNIPVVLFDRQYPDIECSYVGIDNFQSSYLATNHLAAECRRSNIAFIAIDSKQNQMVDRLHGYEKAMFENKLTPLIKKLKFSSQDDLLEKEVYSFIMNNPGLDALLFSTHYLATAGVKAVGKLKLTIPDDISIVSFDDQPFYSLNTPTITAIEQPVEKMANSLIEILMGKIQRRENENKEIVFPAPLHIRESSRQLSSPKRR
jgi:LacI family transcriptional regulator